MSGSANIAGPAGLGALWRRLRGGTSAVSAAPARARGTRHVHAGGDEGRPAAETIAERLPPLLADAERIAASVAGGAHGRRRAGVGDSFWQYRPLSFGESAARIDWRQSARGDRLFVRETEWEAAQTVCLWRDRSPSMEWRSGNRLPTKRTRAELLMLAVAITLLRGGEHLQLVDDEGDRTRLHGRGATERLALRLLDEPGAGSPSLPALHNLPRHARLVLVGDFLSPLPEIRSLLVSLAAVPVSPVLVQVLDPAELAFPFAGRTRFEGTEGEEPVLVAQAADLQHDYAAALEAHQSGLRALCAGTGTPLLVHRTDAAPEHAVLALHEVIGARRGSQRRFGTGPVVTGPVVTGPGG